MKSFFKKIRGKRGFTLTEVLVGISILTIAIVSATNLLVMIVQSNKNNVKTLQAYYYAQEGIEAFRNIRDTNWLHNQDWLNGDVNQKIWGNGFVASEMGAIYEIESREIFERTVADNSEIGLDQMRSYAPWEVRLLSGENDATKNENGLRRVIFVYPYNCGFGAKCEDYARVVSKVFWTDGGSEKKVELNEIFTNWKGGVL